MNLQFSCLNLLNISKVWAWVTSLEYFGVNFSWLNWPYAIYSFKVYLLKLLSRSDLLSYILVCLAYLLVQLWTEYILKHKHSKSKLKQEIKVSVLHRYEHFFFFSLFPKQRGPLFLHSICIVLVLISNLRVVCLDLRVTVPTLISASSCQEDLNLKIYPYCTVSLGLDWITWWGPVWNKSKMLGTQQGYIVEGKRTWHMQGLRVSASAKDWRMHAGNVWMLPCFMEETWASWSSGILQGAGVSGTHPSKTPLLLYFRQQHRQWVFQDWKCFTWGQMR